MYDKRPIILKNTVVTMAYGTKKNKKFVQWLLIRIIKKINFYFKKLIYLIYKFKLYNYFSRNLKKSICFIYEKMIQID